jgi:hypothetical protein
MSDLEFGRVKAWRVTLGGMVRFNLRAPTERLLSKSTKAPLASVSGSFAGFCRSSRSFGSPPKVTYRYL